MTETLREKEELARSESENLRKTREEIEVLRRKISQHDELMTEKDRTAQVSSIHYERLYIGQGPNPTFWQVLHDEISTLQLELTQVEERNSILQRDNAKLLQRWLDAKQAEANKMNQANEFYEDMRTRHQNVLSWREKNSAPPSSAGGDDADMRSAVSHTSTTASGNGVANGDRKLGQTKDGTKSLQDPTTSLSPNG